MSKILSLFFSIFMITVYVLSLSAQSVSEKFYQCITQAPSYSYHLSGRTDRIKGYVVKIDKVTDLTNPGLVFLASDLEKGEGYVDINGSLFELPGLLGQFSVPVDKSEKNLEGKEGWYSYSSGDDIIGKLVIPFNQNLLKNGLNDITFYRHSQSNGFEIIDAIIQNVEQTTPALIGQTYHLLARGRPAKIRDFDYVYNYRGEKKRFEKDIPDWARRGKVNYYRAGIDWDHLDRMFEMFQEARINVVATNVPADINSEEYKRVKAFIDRCHQNGIHVTAFNSLGNLSMREVLLNPELKKWIAQDEFGDYRWREKGGTYAADLNDIDFRQNRLLKIAAAQIDAGVDELYYDWAIGGTGEILDFFSEVRELAKKKGKNISIFGNCKGNILADEACDFTKTEATTEAGVWDGEWVHNIPQARFYYASGDGVKANESKYEGADPGVPHPGAKDIREGMKVGWRRPIAEAASFQSRFAIAEAGDKMLQGWIKKDNPLAMKVWNEICTYYTFVADYRDFYTDVSTLSHIGVLSPPQIPSFEVTLKRDNLYKALAENNIMYEVVLLPRLSTELLAHYRLLIIPNIPWVEDIQLALIREFKKKGGKIYTIGSTNELKEIADVYSPPSIMSQLKENTILSEFLSHVEKLAGESIVSLPNSKYVAANIVKKRGTNRLIVYLVNYGEPLRNVKVKLNLDGFISKIDQKKLKLYSPDNVSTDLREVSINGKKLELTVPELDVYQVLAVN